MDRRNPLNYNTYTQVGPTHNDPSGRSGLSGLYGGLLRIDGKNVGAVRINYQAGDDASHGQFGIEELVNATCSDVNDTSVGLTYHNGDKASVTLNGKPYSITFYIGTTRFAVYLTFGAP